MILSFTSYHILAPFADPLGSVRGKATTYQAVRISGADSEMVLEAAVNGRADLLVTFNLCDYGVIPLQFGIEVLRPCDALRRIAP